VGGSTHAFVALHASMLASGVVAVCALVRSPASEPRLAALVPQREEVGAYGEQATPPGFHLVLLPYADDCRAPEADAGAERPAPPPAAVAAAAELLAALALPEDFDPAGIPNPHLQRHFEVLECIALEEDPGEAPADETLPDAAAFEAAGDVITAFKARAPIPRLPRR
jgi:ATP-dependent DNA helicase 2 subunit 1